MKTLYSAIALAALFSSVAPTAAAAKGGTRPSGALEAVGDASTGFLDVASDPPAKIAIDGNETGKMTPQVHLALPVGHHKLTLVTVDGARQRSIGFTVEAGQTTKLTIHLAS